MADDVAGAPGGGGVTRASRRRELAGDFAGDNVPRPIERGERDDGGVIVQWIVGALRLPIERERQAAAGVDLGRRWVESEQAHAAGVFPGQGGGVIVASVPSLGDVDFRRIKRVRRTGDLHDSDGLRRANGRPGRVAHLEPPAGVDVVNGDLERVRAGRCAGPGGQPVQVAGVAIQIPPGGRVTGRVLAVLLAVEAALLVNYVQSDAVIGVKRRLRPPIERHVQETIRPDRGRVEVVTHQHHLAAEIDLERRLHARHALAVETGAAERRGVVIQVNVLDGKQRDDDQESGKPGDGRVLDVFYSRFFLYVGDEPSRSH